MIPYSNIKVGDMFQNPVFRDGIIWRVQEKNDSEKLILISAFKFHDGKPMPNSSIWKRSKDHIFSESWRFGIR